MKMLLKSNKGSGNFPPLQNIINGKNLEDFAYDDEEKCDLLNKYFSDTYFIYIDIPQCVLYKLRMPCSLHPPDEQNIVVKRVVDVAL
jgi:hypothetical protein